MIDLYTFLDQLSENSDFKAELSRRGGYITFSNSGRRGGIKYFQIGIDNILQTLKDILENYLVFKHLTLYEETPWRDNGSMFFKDPVANANSTVQTKPLFSTLSKVIIWGNYPALNDVDPDSEMIITRESLTNTISKLEDLAKKFIPIERRKLTQLSADSHQIIYYGSPGTGKSWTVQNNVLKDVKEDYIFRTTFHPDTDYSTFVGCYKPISKYSLWGDPNLSEAKLLEIFMKTEDKSLYKGSTKARYWYEALIHTEDLRRLGIDAQTLSQKLKEKGFVNTAYTNELTSGIFKIYDWLKEDSLIGSSSISYAFEPQVFTLAYIKAWQNPTEQVYLVIEEINRGNCAQIFGDLFQLLDRKKGVSEYPVKAETALAEYLSNVLEGDAAEGIRDGKLSLPANLNIIATMNTSDQSLFPMDSAFKRRWDWKYIPTTPPADKSRTMELSFKDKTTTKYGTTIDAGDYEYDWTEFLEKINEKIQNATHSDDKQLGFWFVKTEEGAEEITISSFVSKVVFYLWNDVFKDMGAKDSNPFTIKVDGKNVVMSFNSFFEMNSLGQIVENIGVLHTFLRNVGVEPKVKKAIADAQDAAQAKEMTEEA